MQKPMLTVIAAIIVVIFSSSSYSQDQKNDDTIMMSFELKVCKSDYKFNSIQKAYNCIMKYKEKYKGHLTLPKEIDPVAIESIPHMTKIQALIFEAKVAYAIGKYCQASQAMKQLLDRFYGIGLFHVVHVDYANICAASPDPQCRNGDLAVKFAKKAVEMKKDAKGLLALAAAYAESGDFAKAATVQKQAIKIYEEQPIDDPLIIIDRNKYANELVRKLFVKSKMKEIADQYSKHIPFRLDKY